MNPVNNDIERWLIAARAPGLSGVRMGLLLERFGDIAGVFGAGRDELAAMGLAGDAVRALLSPAPDVVADDLAWLSAPGHSVATLGDAGYPEQLREIRDPPLLLFIKGDASLLKDPQIAIVGARVPTPGGRDNARCLARDLAEAGLLVTSGLARGIDTCAHQAALDAGRPTAAVIATGPDMIYPASNKHLAQAIAERGVLVSEFSCGTPPLATHFPRRNRIISGLALGVLVVEAGERSGSLITARLSGEQGRDVFAVPGSIRNPLAKGCHRLIRDGARLVETSEDVLAELKTQLTSVLNAQAATGERQEPAQPGAVPDRAHRELLEHMGYDPVTVDELVERSQLPVQEVSSMLLILELDGCVGNDGGTYTRIR